jgi:hypothetical protein
MDGPAAGGPDRDADGILLAASAGIARKALKKCHSRAQALLVASLVFIGTLHSISAPAASSTAPVPHGATKAQVQEALGQPNKQLRTGATVTTWYYEDWVIVFKNGSVSGVLARKIMRLPERGTANAPVVSLPMGGTASVASATGPVANGAIGIRGGAVCSRGSGRGLTDPQR